MLVVLHMSPSAKSRLPHILARVTDLPVAPAHGGEPLTGGRVVVAVPDSHLVVHDGIVRVVHGPRVNGHRPAIDPLFTSAARARGTGVLGILVSGTLDDGVVGLGAIRAAGGTTAVQDPHEAAYPDMPDNAIRAGVVDHVADLRGLAELNADDALRQAEVLRAVLLATTGGEGETERGVRCRVLRTPPPEWCVEGVVEGRPTVVTWRDGQLACDWDVFRRAEVMVAMGEVFTHPRSPQLHYEAATSGDGWAVLLTVLRALDRAHALDVQF